MHALPEHQVGDHEIMGDILGGDGGCLLDEAHARLHERDHLGGSDVWAPAGWARPRWNLSDSWRQVRGREPTDAESDVLRQYAARIDRVLADARRNGVTQNAERDFETGYGLAVTYITTGKRVEGTAAARAVIEEANRVVTGHIGPDIWHRALKAAKVALPILKTVATGVAIVFPAAIPAVVALAAADKALHVLEGAAGSPAARAAVKRTIVTTLALAKQGDPGAVRAVEYLSLAKKLRAVHHARRAPRRGRGPIVTGPLVTAQGEIVRGVWQRVG